MSILVENYGSDGTKKPSFFSRNMVGLKSVPFTLVFFLFASRCSSVNAQPNNPQPLGRKQAFPFDTSSVLQGRQRYERVHGKAILKT